MRAALLAVALLLAGCGLPDEYDNRDPRLGRVWLDEDACDLTGCWGPSKLCIGPDLLFILGEHNGTPTKTRTVRQSSECEVAR